MRKLFLLMLMTRFALGLELVRTEALQTKIYLGSQVHLSGEFVFYTSVKNFFSTTEEAHLVKENLRSGNRSWEVAVDGLVSRITEHNGVLLLLTRTDSLYGVNPESGEVLWVKHTNQSDGQGDRVWAVGTRLYYEDSSVGQIEEIEAATGAVIAALNFEGVPRTLLSDGNYLTLNGEPQGLHAPPAKALEIEKKSADGDVLWKAAGFPHPAYLYELFGTPAGGAMGVQYVSALHPSPDLKRRFFAFLLDATGAHIWAREIEGRLVDLGNGQFSYMKGETLFAVASANGSELWQSALSPGHTLLSSVVLNRSLLILDDHEIAHLSKVDGKITSTYDLSLLKYTRLLGANEKYAVLTSYNEKEKFYYLHILSL